jgi:2,3-bisphosphoglycerate-dependent phosphoglycerate mutase
MTLDFLRLGWIRHGQTEWNRLGKIQGTTDVPLDAEGRRQAERLAERLAGDVWRWHGVASSPLSRAAETARIIARRLSVPVVLDDRLRERSFGSAEGTTEAERHARWGTEWRTRVPDMERDEQIQARGLAFVEEWVRRHNGESWLVVTHGSFLARMVLTLCPRLEDPYIRNASLTVMEHRNGTWNTVLHNCTAHVDAVRDG